MTEVVANSTGNPAVLLKAKKIGDTTKGLKNTHLKFMTSDKLHNYKRDFSDGMRHRPKCVMGQGCGRVLGS